MTISASLVMQLRERTGAGMMECKKFLLAANGDIELAVLEMRKAGQARADKKADRIAAEGRIVIARSADGHAAVILEINSETDFVARDENFMSFANQVAELALAKKISNLEDLSQQILEGQGKTVEEARQELIAKIGENIKIRRLELLQHEGEIGSYLHGTKIGVLVAINGGDATLAKDLALQIAASRPLVIQREEVAEELVQRERDIFTAQAKESGKPQEVIDKMIEGRINKYLDEVSLVGQSFVKDQNLTVAKLLKEKNADVLSFIRYEVGEGIEKKVEDFAAEVMAQVKGNE